MARKLYTYTTHITHARHRLSHNWTETTTAVEYGDTRPRNAQTVGKYTAIIVSPDGLTLDLWHIHKRPY